MHRLVRTLEEQVTPSIASRLRIVQEALLSMRVDGRSSSYYLLEIARAIDSGMLLATLVLATTLLEIWVRDLLVIRKVTQHELRSRHELRWLLTKIDREVEGLAKGPGFSNLIRELHQLEVIDARELEWLGSIHGRVRNTLHHGLVGRLLNPEPDDKLLRDPKSKEEMFLASIFSSSPMGRQNSLEQFLDHETPSLLEDVVNFLAAHPIPTLAPSTRQRG